MKELSFQIWQECTLAIGLHASQKWGRFSQFCITCGEHKMQYYATLSLSSLRHTNRHKYFKMIRSHLKAISIMVFNLKSHDQVYLLTPTKEESHIRYTTLNCNAFSSMFLNNLKTWICLTTPFEIPEVHIHQQIENLQWWNNLQIHT